MILYTAASFLAGFVLVALFPRKLAWILSAALLLRVVVPPAAIGIYFWKVHPTITMILGMALAAFLFGTNEFVQNLRRNSIFGGAVLALCAYGSLDYWGGNSKLLSISMLLTTILVAPALILMFARQVVGEDPRNLRVIAWPMVVMAIAQVVLGQMQLDEHKAIYWERAYQSSWWWSNDVTRAVGTTGHGLQLGILMTVAAIFVLTIPWVPVRMAIVPVLLYGTMIGSARTAFVLVILLSIVIIIASLRKPFQTLFSVLCVTLLSIPFFASKSSVVTDLIDKFSNDGSSTERRVAAVQYFVDHMDQFIFLGYKGPRDLRESGVLQSSLENGYLAIAMTFGILFAVLFTLLCVVVGTGGMFRSRSAWYLGVGAIVQLIGFASGNSLLSSGIETIMFWAIAGLGLGVADRSRLPLAQGQTEQAVTPGPDSLPQWRRVARGLR